jgi:hypothetical protein
MSIAVKVVLSNDEDDEIELGPFSQGVLFDSRGLVDVASSSVVASRAGYGWRVLRGAWSEESLNQAAIADAGEYGNLHVFAHWPPSFVEQLRSIGATDDQIISFLSAHAQIVHPFPLRRPNGPTPEKVHQDEVELMREEGVHPESSSVDEVDTYSRFVSDQPPLWWRRFSSTNSNKSKRG